MERWRRMPRWETMPEELLLLIFEKLRPSSSDDDCFHRDIISAAWVCKSWHSACRSACVELFLLEGEDALALDRFGRLMKEPEEFIELLRKVMEEEKERFANTTWLIFPENIFLSREDIIFIAKRTPKVKRLRKLRNNMVDVEGLSIAMEHYWKEIDDVFILYVRETCSYDILNAFGHTINNVFLMPIDKKLSHNASVFIEKRRLRSPLSC